MVAFKHLALTSLALIGFAMSADAANTPLPDAIAAPGYTVALTLHAEGAQVYECKADASGKPGWVFREPIATLLADGKTVGRHYAGPTWEYSDGSAVAGKSIGSASGATPQDIPWLKLDVASQRGNGVLTGTAIVQRINTKGGIATGACTTVGAFLSAPYSADYVFLRKPSRGA